MKTIILSLFSFFLIHNSFAQRISFDEFEQMKVNNQLSLNQLLQSDSPHQLIEQVLNIEFNTDCDKSPVGEFCYYTINGIYQDEWDGVFTEFNISNPNFHLYFGNKVIKIGDSKSSVLSKFNKPPFVEKLYPDEYEGKTYLYLPWYIDGATHTYLQFFFDPNTQKLVKYALEDVLN